MLIRANERPFSFSAQQPYPPSTDQTGKIYKCNYENVNKPVIGSILVSSQVQEGWQWETIYLMIFTQLITRQRQFMKGVSSSICIIFLWAATFLTYNTVS